MTVTQVVVQSLSRVWLLWPHGLRHARFPCPSLSSQVCSNSCPLSRWWYLTISSCVALFSLCPQSFPASRSFPISVLFASGDQSIGTSASASVLPMDIQGWFQGWLVWSLCCPRDSEESFSAPQFKSINSLALSLLYGPAFTSMHDYWKNRSFDYTALCPQSDVCAF